MQTNQNTQAIKKWSAKLNQQTQQIQIEINDGATYIGSVSLIPGMNVKKLFEKIEKAEVEIIAKTTTNMEIQIGLIPVTLHSKQSLEIIHLKAKIFQLESQIKLRPIWQNLDLDSKEEFSGGFIYKLRTENGFGFIPTQIRPNQLFFYWNRDYYSISSTSKRKLSNGEIITEIKKMIV